ncbi:unnamed protein product [Linum tenue]|uniref:DUF7731 domain-containing protein n=2 Tax=Linum tenue TaxID=586396 RepID=A0AAV0HAY5_9ROSI|nr:unnamed protein product [Linum tenue]
MGIAAYRTSFLCLSIAVAFLLFPLCATAENPLTNVNLSPFCEWRSAYDCMQNFSKSCEGKDVLTLAGVVDVNDTEVGEYCKEGGCWKHTTDVLYCISLVKRDFWFSNKATVSALTNAIHSGCQSMTSFSTANYTVATSGATARLIVSRSSYYYLPLFISMFLVATHLF